MQTLYAICMEYVIPRMERHARGGGAKETCNAMEKLAGSIAEDLLSHAFRMVNHEGVPINTVWKDEWRIFYTSKIMSAILSWDAGLIGHVGQQCKNLRRMEVVHMKDFKAEPFTQLPKTVITVDFDGELVRRGQITKPLLFEEVSNNWLPDAEEILKALQVLRKKPPEFVPTPGILSLCELHLGTVHATANDLKIIIQNCPCLRLLRHYQLVTALYELHSEAWKNKKSLPTYKLKNLDVDFSHVVRCRMSPGWVLSPEALQLAVLLCPNTLSIRVRFDCSTPHDVLAPLMTLEKLKEFSAVCVSSGERTLLDFSDMTPILEKYGPISLSFLELKVIEEVEIHIIIEHCTKVETLILSGCGYVTPPTCASFNCQAYSKGSFKKLRLLFFADGDDFSWDHGAPECFWKASLFPSGRNRIVHLEGLFLEFPRIPVSLGKEIFHQSKTNVPRRLPFPELRVLSLCRYEEVTVEDIASICGLSSGNDKESLRSAALQYVRLSECEKIDDSEGKRLKNWMKQCDMHHVKLHVDR